MGARSQLLADRKVSVTMTSTEAPPGASFVDISAWRSGDKAPAPRDAGLALVGDQVTDQTIAGGKVWAKNADLVGGVPCVIGYLPEAAIVSTTKGIFVPLADVAGSFTHIAVSGTPSAGAVTGQAAPIEASE